MLLIEANNRDLRVSRDRMDPGTLALLEKAGIAHELGNLIQIASSAINILARTPQIRDAADLDPVLGGARTSLDRAASIVRQTLLQAMESEAAPEAIQVDRSLIDVERVILYTWPPEVSVKLFLQPGLPRVVCDPMALHNVILNLALNARAAMPDGGEIAIAAKVVLTGEGAPIVQISVSDTGIGMTADTIRRAFEPFFTTKSKGLGGLGLSIVKRFVQEAGGTIDIDSMPGVGTRVILQLPAAP